MSSLPKAAIASATAAWQSLVFLCAYISDSCFLQERTRLNESLSGSHTVYQASPDETGPSSCPHGCFRPRPGRRERNRAAVRLAGDPTGPARSQRSLHAPAAVEPDTGQLGYRQTRSAIRDGQRAAGNNAIAFRAPSWPLARFSNDEPIARRGGSVVSRNSCVEEDHSELLMQRSNIIVIIIRKK